MRGVYSRAAYSTAINVTVDHLLWYHGEFLGPAGPPGDSIGEDSGGGDDNEVDSPTVSRPTLLLRSMHLLRRMQLAWILD